MLTPDFVVTQDEKFVFIKIKVSTIRFNAAALEMAVEGSVFVFYLSPYYLRLAFPHEVVDDERASAKYCSKDESIDIQLPKLKEGTFFEDLDVPTKLLARRGDLIGADAASKRDDRCKKPLIQEIGSGNENLEKEDLQAISAAGDSFSWEIEQTADKQNSRLLSIKYGFEDAYDTSVSVSVSNGNDINELDDPERTTPNNRVKERLRKEDLKFDPEYYVSEYMIKRYASPEDLVINGIEEVMKFTPPLVKDYLKWYKNSDDRNSVMPIVFTEKEQEQMQKYIPRKEYLVSEPKKLYVTILCLLFAYIFEQMETGGVHNTESAWSIGKLTPQICFLDQQLLLKDATEGVSLIKAAIITGIRRSLSYPLHRNYDLSTKAWTFVYYVLRGGKRLVTRCLLDIHEIFRFHDVYYVYNRILLDDLCSWFISQGSENVTRSLALEMKKELDQISKDEIEFNCISGVDEDTGELATENMTIREMEILAERQFQESEGAS
ncbi:hypothetical protein HG536_0B03290 [Torulaspora globosa]|uniref:CS domain-containing protein n=1 Tax=Torulaspora globosa TaxID=48254 RepID=A0A7G3ZD80_9SACH|nr:uncharacterized protein HG536_0B03290 [Torulaspora globosa]QLL31466.1 hypothetical protein HG536_0B03290 [Torulaspora globosa]